MPRKPIDNGLADTTLKALGNNVVTTANVVNVVYCWRERSERQQMDRRRGEHFRDAISSPYGCQNTRIV